MKTNTPELQYRYVNRLVGVLVFSTLLLFVLAVLGSGRVREWLNPGARIRIILPEAGLSGLSVGADVEILGTTAGKVVDIVIDPKQRIYAEVAIQQDMTVFVRQDSRPVIRKRFGVAGAAYLEITRGFGEPLDWEYAVLEADVERAPTESVGELINEVREKIFPAIDDARTAIRTFKSLAQDLSDPQGDLQQLLGGLNTIAARIAHGEGAVGRLIAKEDLADDLQGLLADSRSLVKHLVPVVDELAVTADNLSAMSGVVSAQSKNLPEILQALQKMLGSVNVALDDLAPELPGIARNMGDASADLPVLLIQTQEVMASLEQLLLQLRSHWLLGGRAPDDARTSSRISPQEVHP